MVILNNVAICISVNTGLIPSGLNLRIVGPCGNSGEISENGQAFCLYHFTVSQFMASWEPRGGECLPVVDLSVKILLHCCLSFHVLIGHLYFRRIA